MSSVESIITSAPFFSWLIVSIIEAGNELLYRCTRSRINIDWASSSRTLLGVRASYSTSAGIGRVAVGVRSCISSCDRTTSGCSRTRSAPRKAEYILATVNNRVKATLKAGRNCCEMTKNTLNWSDTTCLIFYLMLCTTILYPLP
jgi:hypothetical protein